MAFVQTTDKWTAIHAFINMWLKDETVYCNNCGQKFIGEGYDCCDNMQRGTNKTYTAALLQQNKVRQATRLNQYGSNDKKTFRIGVSMLPSLVNDLERYCKLNMGEKLWSNDKEFNTFMKRFPMFRVCEKV
jgi:hypothetical protein